MVKVGILSMQRIANYGSFLQAYGLKKILEELGCDVQFVDYHPGKPLIASESKNRIIRKMIKVLEVLKSKAPMSEKIKFIKYKKNFAANYYPFLGLSEEYNYSSKVDLLVIGSDEVFNCIQGNTNVGYCPELFGVGNNASFLISYAASFGNTTEEKIDEFNIRNQVAEWLNSFDELSLRDANSVTVARSLSGKEVVRHLDPVLMYDFSKLKDIIAENTKLISDKYMILYGYSDRFTAYECANIKRYAKENGLIVVCIGGVQQICDRFVDCNPFEVLQLFSNAECVVTDTFHGTIMSIITHRQFVSVVRNSGYGNSEKLTDLLKTLKLENRELYDFGNMSDLLGKEIIYDEVDKILAYERDRTNKYLEKWISIARTL